NSTDKDFKAFYQGAAGRPQYRLKPSTRLLRTGVLREVTGRPAPVPSQTKYTSASDGSSQRMKGSPGHVLLITSDDVPSPLPWLSRDDGVQCELCLAPSATFITAIFEEFSVGVNPKRCGTAETNTPANFLLTRVRTSATRGTVTQFGFDGTTYHSDNMDAEIVLDPPSGHVLMFSFPHFDLDWNTRCAQHDFLEAKTYDKGEQTLFRVTAGDYVPPQVYQFKIKLIFVADDDRTRTGFKMLYTIHPVSEKPTEVGRGVFNCSVPHFHTFKEHLTCNVATECAGGEDETDCPYSSTECGPGYIDGILKCYKYVDVKKELSWYDAYNECKNRGMDLVSPRTPTEWQNFRDILNSAAIQSYTTYVGLRTSLTSMAPYYRDVWQWSDNTMAYYVNLEDEKLLPKQKCAYISRIFPEKFRITDCGTLVVVPYIICEKHRQNTNVSASPAIPSFTDVTIANVWPVSIHRCPDGHVTQDFLSCDPTTHCKIKEYPSSCYTTVGGKIPMFECDRGAQTLHYSLVCDHQRGCADNSDEEFCVFASCPDRECGNHQCVASQHWCDVKGSPGHVVLISSDGVPNPSPWLSRDDGVQCELCVVPSPTFITAIFEEFSVGVTPKRCGTAETNTPANFLSTHVQTSATRGTVTQFGFDGTTYHSDNMDAHIFVHPPSGHVLMFSFPHFDLDWNTRCARHDFLEAKTYVKGEQTLFRITADDYVPPQVYQFLIRLIFVTDDDRTRTGFKMLYTIHPVSEKPTEVGRGVFNCSVPHFHTFKEHLTCNVATECAGGEDETDCPYTSTECGPGYIDGILKCYKYVDVKKELSWYDAYNECKNRGMDLVSPRTPTEWQNFRDILNSTAIQSYTTYVGLRTSLTSMAPYYRDVWQWSDNTMAYYVNLEDEKLLPKQKCAYISRIFPEKFRITDCGTLMDVPYIICEKHRQNTNVSASPAIPSFTDVTIANVWPVSIHRCPDGHVTQDFLSCDPTTHCRIKEYPSSCYTTVGGKIPMFECDRGAQTLHYSLVCDHQRGCADNSDEEFCVFASCPDRECGNHQCVASQHWCDGVQHCVDGSDEDCLDFVFHTTSSVPPPAVVDLDGRGSLPKLKPISHESGLTAAGEPKVGAGFSSAGDPTWSSSSLDGPEVKLITTKNSRHIFDVDSITCPVFTDENEWKAWSQLKDPVLHIDLRRWADMLVIAPLDANTLAKIAHDICDNLLVDSIRIRGSRAQITFHTFKHSEGQAKTRFINSISGPAGCPVQALNDYIANFTDKDFKAFYQSAVDRPQCRLKPCTRLLRTGVLREVTGRPAPVPSQTMYTSASDGSSQRSDRLENVVHGPELFFHCSAPGVLRHCSTSSFGCPVKGSPGHVVLISSDDVPNPSPWLSRDDGVQCELCTVPFGRSITAIFEEFSVGVTPERCGTAETNTPANFLLTHVRTSATRGTVTQFGFDGTTYHSDNMDAQIILDPSSGHVLMFSFPHFDLDWNTRCARHDFLEAKTYDKGEQTLFRETAGDYVPPQVYQFKIKLIFVTDDDRTRTGFKMLYTIHPVSEKPTEVGRGVFNCSVPHFHTFKEHLTCNVATECSGGEDETDCPYTSTECGPGYIDGILKCYKYVNVNKELSWYDAYNECKNRGMELVSPRTPTEWQNFRDILNSAAIQSYITYVGLRTSLTNMAPYYRDVWRWSDNTMAYYVNLEDEKMLPKPKCAYISRIFPEKFRITDCGALVDVPYIICEKHRQNTNVSASPAIPSFTDVTIANVWPVSIHRCPDGHVTQHFLSCDPTTHCKIKEYPSSCYTTVGGNIPMFECDRGAQTLHYSLVCDHQRGCADNSDEEFCVFASCPDRECGNHQCVASQHWCDGVQHCVDGSDEDCPDFVFRTTSSVPPPAVVDLDGRGTVVHGPELFFHCSAPGVLRHCSTSSFGCPVKGSPGHVVLISSDDVPNPSPWLSRDDGVQCELCTVPFPKSITAIFEEFSVGVTPKPCGTSEERSRAADIIIYDRSFRTGARTLFALCFYSKVFSMKQGFILFRFFPRTSSKASFRVRLIQTNTPANFLLTHVRTSATRGTVTQFGFDGTTYHSDNMDADIVVDPPLRHVLMFSFPHFDLDWNTRCARHDFLEAKTYDKGEQTLFRITADDYVPPQVYQFQIQLIFVTDDARTRTGFKMLYTIHPVSEKPTEVGRGVFNCSVPHFHTFKEHLTCNVATECAGGEDETDCPYTSTECGPGYIDGISKCYKYVDVKKELSWYDAYNECKNRGMELVSPRTPAEWQNFRDILNSTAIQSYTTYIGLRTSLTSMAPYYRDVWQWSDNTMAYYVNLEDEKLLPKPKCAYISRIFPEKFRITDCGALVDVPYIICEKHRQHTNVSASPAVPSFTDVTIANVWPVSIHRCPDGHVTQDFLSCDPTTHCKIKEYPSSCYTTVGGKIPMFECDRGAQTLHYSLVCDHQRGCADNSDEEFCSFASCPDRECGNHQCVASQHWCDGVQHCVDGSDEDCPQFVFHTTSSVPPPAVVDLDGRGREYGAYWETDMTSQLSVLSSVIITTDPLGSKPKCMDTFSSRIIVSNITESSDHRHQGRYFLSVAGPVTVTGSRGNYMIQSVP
ncbi:hypothetical protein BaRGS_00019479, partial [Batillaria attramentaria]